MPSVFAKADGDITDPFSAADNDQQCGQSTSYWIGVAGSRQSSLGMGSDAIHLVVDKPKIDDMMIYSKENLDVER